MVNLADVNKLWVTTYSQLLKAELSQLYNVEKNSISTGLNDIIIAPSVLLDNPLCPRSSRAPNWVSFMNFCTLIESLILNEHVFLRLPGEKKDLIINAVAINLVARELGLAPEDLENILQISVGISETATTPDALDNIYIFPQNTIKGWQYKLSQELKDDPFFESERAEWEAVLEHIGHEKVAATLSCSYMSGFDRGGDKYQKILSARTETLRRLTPQRFYELIKDSIKTEVEELRTAGWTGDLYLPPIALLVLNKCRGDKKHLGEIVLEERQKAARFRDWVCEIRTEFVNASNINEASRLHKKLQNVFRDFAGSSDIESWRTTSWNGLLAAFPKSIWDGLSKDDVDIKSLISFLAQKPLKVIIDLIRQRNYVYILDVRGKVRRINEYATLAEKVLTIHFSDEDIRSLKSLSCRKTA